MENIRHWYLQKPKEHNCPHNNNVAVFQEFKPTVGYDGFEWIKVISLDDFHKEVGINITKYIQLQKDLALAREGLKEAEQIILSVKDCIECSEGNVCDLMIENYFKDKELEK